VAVVITADPATPVVMADPGQVEQVVLNLAVNARDAMPDGGRLEISVSPRRIDPGAAGPERAEGDYGQLTVRDQGEGISEAILPHIFEPFFSTKGAKGTGLGLSTVYGIATQHGGFIDVESAPGQGTRISVAFPAAPPGALPVAAPATPAPVREGHGEMVLLVEDDPSVRVATFSMLRRIGYRVLEADDGVAAEEVAAAFPGQIDVLLTDVVMPRRNGREAAERLAAVRPGLAVVFMSGYTQDVIDRAGVLETGLHLLRKPFTAAQLAEALQTALARRPATGVL
jgi:signal transduction histidine kinase